MSEIDLSHRADLVLAARSADERRRFHLAEAEKYERARDEIRDELAREMGDAEVGLVNGKPVITKKESMQFAVAKFREAHPDIFEAYKRLKVVDDLDKAKLKAELPEVFAEFAVTRWTLNPEALG